MCVDEGSAAKVLRVGCRRIEERGGMEVKGGVAERGERKITVSQMRVTAWGSGCDGELAMP